MLPHVLAALLAVGATDANPTSDEPIRVTETADVPVVPIAEGVTVRELIGRTSAGSARTTQASIALFHLDPGKASAWSHNKVGEESFLVLKGTGTVWIGNTSQPVRAGSFIVIPADHIRSIRASAKEPLEFYALTTPAWSKEDDVLAPAPAHTNVPAG